ncbi:MAG: LLM class flavin-dependent oxidoreductase [Acidimicrobiia bacterium]|nr:LLM class flavin-dependent oxidoreductase [Acidimicrobiia bacterium]
MPEALKERLGPIGAALPQGSPANTDVAASAESAGYGALWVSDLTSAPVLDPLLCLTTAAAQTERALIGVAVILVPLHQPIRLASQLASLDQLSKGRLVVGVGFGSRPEIYGRYGLDPNNRLTRYLDALALIRELWTTDSIDYDNGLWQIEGPTNVVAPAQSPGPPVVIGARQPNAVRRAVRAGDGWVISGSAPPGEIEDALRVAREELELIGKPAEEFPVIRRMYVCVAENDRNGLERSRAWFGENYGNPDIADRSVTIGSKAAVAERIHRELESGIDHVIVNPMFDEVVQLESLAQELEELS